LVDTFGGHPISEFIPFDFENAPNAYVNNTVGLDFGVVRINQHFRRLFGRNRVIPIWEKAWKNDWTRDPDCYFFLGLPKVLYRVSATDQAIALDLTPLLIRIEKTNEPFPILVNGVYRFYGRVIISWGFDEIYRMGGGPVFGVIDQGDKWQIRSVAAFPLKIIGRFLGRSAAESAEWQDPPDGTANLR